jgi:hypothetical protein
MASDLLFLAKIRNLLRFRDPYTIHFGSLFPEQLLLFHPSPQSLRRRFAVSYPSRVPYTSCLYVPSGIRAFRKPALHTNASAFISSRLE